MPSAAQIIRFIGQPAFKHTVNHLYGRETAGQSERYTQLIGTFVQNFGDGDIHIFSTPGRTEIGGNHTDHNHGRVLAASVNLDSIAAATPVKDNLIELYSAGYENPFKVDISDLSVRESEKESTEGLIRGIAAGFKRPGYKIGGFKGCMTSDVLVGSGLSSSASIEVLIATILNTFYNENTLDPVTLAQISQYAENVHFGKPCGLMDQTACAVGGIISIDFEDPEKPVVKKVDFDFGARGYSLIVVDTGGNHADLTEDYASIPGEMKSIAAHFNKDFLRGIDFDTLYKAIPELRAKYSDRALLRALHFIGDNERVSLQISALEKGDFLNFLKLVTESGNSSFKMLQNIYSTHNVEEQGISLALSLTEQFLAKLEGGACRVHGGGFAGTIQVFLPRSHTDTYRQLMEPVFGSNSVLELMIRPVGSYHFAL